MNFPWSGSNCVCAVCHNFMRLVCLCVCALCIICVTTKAYHWTIVRREFWFFLTCSLSFSTHDGVFILATSFWSEIVNPILQTTERKFLRATQERAIARAIARKKDDSCFESSSKHFSFSPVSNKLASPRAASTIHKGTCTHACTHTRPHTHARIFTQNSNTWQCKQVMVHQKLKRSSDALR